MSVIKHAAVSAVVFGMLALANQGAQAGGGRSIRVDVGDSNFADNGQSWTGSNELLALQAFGGIPFNLNFSGALGSGGHYSYNFSRAPAWDAFLGLSDSSTGIDGTIFPFYVYSPQGGTVSWSSGEWSVGVIDTEGPFIKSEAVAAIRFTWMGQLSTGGNVAAQFIFLDRSNGGVQGDFDIELNYGYGMTFDFPAVGAQQLSLGGQTFFGGIAGGVLTDLCFRNGVGTDCGVGVVPEPSSYALLALGLAGVAVPVLRRRRRFAGA